MRTAADQQARSLQAAFSAFEKAGRPVKAVRFYVDGSFALLTDLGDETLPEHAVETSWVEAAGEARPGRA